MRHNLITNPKAGTDTTGWTAGNGTLTAVALADEGVAAPSEGCATGLKLVRTASVPYVTSSALAVTGGKPYAIRLARYVGVAPSGAEYLSVNAYTDVGLTNLVGTFSDFTISAEYASGWHTFSMAVTLPADAAYVTLMFRGRNEEAYTAYLTAIQLEQAATVNAYGDGDTAGWTWDGTEELSASSETASQWVGTEGILDAVKDVLTAGLSSQLAVVQARYADGVTLEIPDTTTGYLTALMGSDEALMRDALLNVTTPSIIILAGDSAPDTGHGQDGRDLTGAYDTLTDVLVGIRVKADSLTESDKRLMRSRVAVTELLCAPSAFSTYQCSWLGEASTVIELPGDDGYMLRTLAVAFRLRSFDEL